MIITVHKKSELYFKKCLCALFFQSIQPLWRGISWNNAAQKHLRYIAKIQVWFFIDSSWRVMTLSIFQCLVLMPNGELQSCLSVWGLLGCEVLSRDQSVFHLFFLKFRFSSFSIGLWELWQKVDLLQFLDFIDFIDPVFIEKREKTKIVFSIDNYR